MSLKLKTHVEDQKRSLQIKLEARRAFLKEKGFSDEQIRKDVITRMLKADVRKADSRLASIAAQEKQNQSLARIKAEKKAAGKAPKKEAKEQAPEKKEKKVKKEKPEKQAKPQGKKERPEEEKEEPPAE